MLKKKIKEEHKNLTSEEIAAKQKEIEKQIEALMKDKSSLGLVKRGQSGKERQIAAIYGNFCRKNHKKEYEDRIKSDTFNKYLNRNQDRELFGFAPLPTTSIPEEYREIAKELGSIYQLNKEFSIPFNYDKDGFLAELKKRYEDGQKIKKENKISEDKAEESKKPAPIIFDEKIYLDTNLAKQHNEKLYALGCRGEKNSDGGTSVIAPAGIDLRPIFELNRNLIPEDKRNLFS